MKNTIPIGYLVAILLAGGFSAAAQHPTGHHPNALQQLEDSLHRTLPNASPAELNRQRRSHHRQVMLDGSSAGPVRQPQRGHRRKIRKQARREKDWKRNHASPPVKKKPSGKAQPPRKPSDKVTSSLFAAYPLLASRQVVTESTPSNFNQVPDALEYQALKALYESTGGNQWTQRENWPADNWPDAATVTWHDFAVWYGIDVVNGDVSNIKLANNNLQNSLPAELELLDACAYLDLDNNQITALPAKMGGMAALSTLYLENNALTGLPEGLTQATSLEVIDLAHNQLGSLPTTVDRWTNLRYLYLNDNQLTSLPDATGGMTSLEIFNLGNNRLTQLPNSIGGLDALDRLSLINNELNSLPETLGDMDVLYSLNLQDNNLSTLPASISQLQSLFVLNLTGNNFSQLPTAVTDLAYLDALLLDNNSLSSLPATLSNLFSLTTLTLSGNNFTGFPTPVLDLPFLMELHLNDNQVSSIPAEIDQLIDLTFLFMNGNQLTALPDGLSEMPFLWSLMIADNPFAGFPTEVLECVELLQLDVSRLNLTELPEALRTDMPYLAFLYADGNELDFADLEAFFSAPGETFLEEFTYQDQAPLVLEQTAYYLTEGATLEVDLTVAGEHNVYFWERQLSDGTWQAVGDGLAVSNVGKEDDGTYRAVAENDWVPNARLTTGDIEVDVYYQNYVLEEDILTPGITTLEQVKTLDYTKKSSNWVYYDGLQKPLQQIAAQSSPGGKDVISVQQYDALARQPKSYPALHT